MTSLLHPLFVVLTSLTRQDLARQVVFMREKNRVFGARLFKCVVATPTERSQLLKLERGLSCSSGDATQRQLRHHSPEG